MGHTDLRRRLLEVQTEQTGRLPAEYQEVEWIESNGSQYINANVNRQDAGFEVKFISYDEISDSDYGCILGARFSSNSYDLELNTYTSASHPTWSGTFRYGSSTENYDAHLNPKGEVNVIKYLNGTYTANGTDYAYSAGTISNTRFIYLFALHNNQSVAQNAKVRMYYCKIYQLGELAADLVPCYRKSDGVIGMYDLVQEAFRTNAGSGDFTKGGNV